MPATFEPIASTTLSADASSFTFSSIPTSYTDLVLVVQAASTTTANDLFIKFNSDGGTNYSYTLIYGDGSSAGSARDSNAVRGLADYYGTPDATVGNSVQIINIMNYSNTTTNKTYISRSSRASGGTDALVGLWRSTNAITSIEALIASRTLKSGSTFSLYGIREGA